jgi:hypothetical protein
MGILLASVLSMGIQLGSKISEILQTPDSLEEDSPEAAKVSIELV